MLQEVLRRRGPNITVPIFADDRVPATAQKDKALFLVRKHPTMKGTYVGESYFSAPREKDNPDFAKQVTEVLVFGRSATKGDEIFGVARRGDEDASDAKGESGAERVAKAEQKKAEEGFLAKAKKVLVSPGTNQFRH